MKLSGRKNKTGVPGVSPHPSGYMAELSVRGKRYRKLCPSIQAAKELIQYWRDTMDYSLEQQLDWISKGLHSKRTMPAFVVKGRHKKLKVEIDRGGKTHTVGYYYTQEDAVNAYVEAERSLYGSSEGLVPQ